MCTHVLQNGIPVPRDEVWNQKFREANERFGKNGERVLGFAQLHLPLDKYPKGYDFKVDNPNFPFK